MYQISWHLYQPHFYYLLWIPHFIIKTSKSWQCVRMTVNVLGFCLWWAFISLSVILSNATCNWRVSLREKKEWGLRKEAGVRKLGSQNEGGGREKMRVWQKWEEWVWGEELRGGGRVRLILLLEPWRLTLCVSDWSHQYPCRPEMCVHALCTDVTVMYKQIHINIFLQCDELLPTVTQCTVKIWIQPRWHHDEIACPVWSLPSHIKNLSNICIIFFCFSSTVSISTLTVCFFSLVCMLAYFRFCMLLVFLSHFLSLLSGWKDAFFPLTPLHAVPPKKKSWLCEVYPPAWFQTSPLWFENHTAVVWMCLSVILRYFPGDQPPNEERYCSCHC